MEYQPLDIQHDNIEAETNPVVNADEVQTGGFLSSVQTLLSSATSMITFTSLPADASLERMDMYDVAIESPELTDDEVVYLTKFITDPDMEIRANYSRHRIQRIFRKLEKGANAAFTSDDPKYQSAVLDLPALSEREVKELRQFVDNGDVTDVARLHNILAKMTAGAYRSGRLPSPLVDAMKTLYSSQDTQINDAHRLRKQQENNAVEELRQKRMREQMELERLAREQEARELEAREVAVTQEESTESVRQRKRQHTEEVIPPPQPAIGKTPSQPSIGKTSSAESVKPKGRTCIIS